MDAMGIDVPALAKQTGYNRKSVYQFFKDEHIANKFLAASIADALRICKSDWAYKISVLLQEKCVII